MLAKRIGRGGSPSSGPCVTACGSSPGRRGRSRLRWLNVPGRNRTVARVQPCRRLSPCLLAGCFALAPEGGLSLGGQRGAGSLSHLLRVPLLRRAPSSVHRGSPSVCRAHRGEGQLCPASWGRVSGFRGRVGSPEAPPCVPGRSPEDPQAELAGCPRERSTEALTVPELSPSALRPRR